MCGIAGIISVDPGLVSTQRLTQMTSAIKHRGPDGEYCWVNKTTTAGFGHRRLSIIDLSAAAAQPMHYLSRYTIIYNGEIYNYKELRNTLLGKGYQFSTASDTEVILAAYDCWKQNCLEQFDGMFAFAIWDEETKCLFAARDRLGEKPFYYFFDGQQFVFASEIKALWAAGIPKNVNKTSLYNFLTIGYTQNPGAANETAFSNIHKLPAAAYLQFQPGLTTFISTQVYWKPIPAINNRISEAEAVDQFTALLQDAVAKRLRADVPIGNSLSGGLDSSSIAVLIQQLQKEGPALQTFSAVFPGFKGDESRYIQLLTAAKGFENSTTAPSADDFAADFERLAFHQEGYMSSASVYAQFKVFELAKEKNVTVLLDGQGADELLAGYHKYYHWYWQELYKQNNPQLNDEIAAARRLGIDAPWGWKNKLSARFPLLAGNYLASTRKRKQLATPGLSKDFIAAFGHSYYQLPRQDSLLQVLAYNSFTNGLEELLQYADKNSMAHGREVRLPFLQFQLVEFLFSLPAHYKIKEGWTKWLLRKAMEKKLPAEITWRTDKIGFEPPQKQWMQHPGMQEYVQQARRKMVEARILDAAVLNTMLQPMHAHDAGNADWRILVAARML